MINTSDLDPIKETGFVDYEEHDVSSLYEVDGKFYIKHSGSCFFHEKNYPDTIEEISLEAAIEFIDEPDVIYPN